jgi:uncharacterized OB-fold protein
VGFFSEGDYTRIMSPIREETDQYTRQYLDQEGKIVESVCNNCGKVLVGSVTHGLRQREIQHTVECPVRKSNGTPTK